jgi:hypothetical protein
VIGPFELLAFMSGVGAGAVTVTEQVAFWLPLVTVTVFVPVVE